MFSLHKLHCFSVLHKSSCMHYHALKEKNRRLLPLSYGMRFEYLVCIPMVRQNTITDSNADQHVYHTIPLIHLICILIFPVFSWLILSISFPPYQNTVACHIPYCIRTRQHLSLIPLCLILVVSSPTFLGNYSCTDRQTFR